MTNREHLREPLDVVEPLLVARRGLPAIARALLQQRRVLLQRGVVILQPVNGTSFSDFRASAGAGSGGGWPTCRRARRAERRAAASSAPAAA